MNCKDVIGFLMDYLDGELSADQAANFELHLSQCPSCVAYLKTYEQTTRIERQALLGPEDAPPEPLPDALVQAILVASSSGRR